MAEYLRRQRYNFSHEKRGTAYIINNVDFDAPAKGYQKRFGSDKDTKVMWKTFERLGFASDDIFEYRSITKDKMRECLQDSVRKDDHANSDCFACVIMSHGNYFKQECGLYAADAVFGKDGPVPLRDLIKIVEECKELEGKPKIFIVQACRGHRLSEPVELAQQEVVTSGQAADEEEMVDAWALPPRELQLTEDEREEISKMPDPVLPFEIPISKDTILIYATQPGFFSFRHTQQGSPFINHLCRQVHSEEARQMDFLSLLTRVNRDVAFSFTARSKAEPFFSGKKMMPWIASRLTKDIVFSPPGESSSFPIQETTMEVN